MEWSDKYKLRPRQRQACQRLRHGYTKPDDDGAGPWRRQLLIAGTGAGKTIMASAMVIWNYRCRNRPTLMLANSDELCGQAMDKIAEATGEFPDLEKADRRASLDAPVVVGSFQTLANRRRLERFPADHFGLVIADEAHLSMAPTFLKTLEYFNADDNTLTLGITATPERADRKSLMTFYESVADEISLVELIESKSLVPIFVQTLPIEIDASHVTTFDADENTELEEAIIPYYDAIIEQWKIHASDRPTLCFHPTVHSSKLFTERLRASGVEAAEHVDGTSKDRAAILERFKTGQIDFLNNAQLLVAGYDEPRISCVINLRPTRHRTPYTQMVGRGTRLCEGKDDLLLLDFLWQFADMGILRPVDLFTTSDDVADIGQKYANDGERRNLQQINIEAQRERDQQLIDRMKNFAGERGGIRDARTFAAEIGQPDLVDFESTRQWHDQAISESQRISLQAFCIDVDTVAGRGHASQIIGRVYAMREAGQALPEFITRASPKQVALIARNRWHPAPETLSFIDASQLLDRKIGNKVRKYVRQ